MLGEVTMLILVVYCFFDVCYKTIHDYYDNYTKLYSKWYIPNALLLAKTHWDLGKLNVLQEVTKIIEHYRM